MISDYIAQGEIIVETLYIFLLNDISFKNESILRESMNYSTMKPINHQLVMRPLIVKEARNYRMIQN